MRPRHLIAGLGAALLLAAPALADTTEVRTTLEGQYWFVDGVGEEGGVTTVRFDWTDSYFAANACAQAVKAAGGTAGDVSVAFGDAEPRPCTEVAADPDASITTAPQG